MGVCEVLVGFKLEQTNLEIATRSNALPRLKTVREETWDSKVAAQVGECATRPSRTLDHKSLAWEKPTCTITGLSDFRVIATWCGQLIANLALGRNGWLMCSDHGCAAKNPRLGWMFPLQARHGDVSTR